MKTLELFKEIERVEREISSIRAEIKKERNATQCIIAFSFAELSEISDRLKHHKSLLRFPDYSCNDPIIQKIDETIKEYESSI